MGYKLFNRTGEEVNLHDLQDKGPWCATGVSYEETFITKYGEQLSLKINPKKIDDIYAPDLLNVKSESLGDLKTQNTPFFQAATRYHINPQFAVTFNLKDFQRYSRNYPQIEIYFWVYWSVIKFEGSSKIEVLPLEGIWFIPFNALTELILKAPLHEYVQRRDDDKGNAKSSFVLNLQDPNFKKLV